MVLLLFIFFSRLSWAKVQTSPNLHWPKLILKLTFRVKFAEDGLEVGLGRILDEGRIPVGNSLSILRMMNKIGKMK